MNSNTPTPKDSTTRRRLRAQPSKDTGPELALRRRLHSLGLRYRIHHPPLEELKRRRADVVFTKAKVAVFVDGCFWHGCPSHGTIPKNNRDWWTSKIEANRARDADTDRRLRMAGWTPVRIWEHEEPSRAARRVARIVESCRDSSNVEGKP